MEFSHTAGGLTLALFGGTREHEVGCTVTGLPAGERVDVPALREYMQRRAPRADELSSTPRREDDGFTVACGMTEDGVLTGEPLRCIIPNKDAKPDGRKPLLLRPSHADYSAYMKYGEDRPDVFSGRMSAPMVFAGGIARQLLSARGAASAVHIMQIGCAMDAPFDFARPEAQFAALDPYFPLVDPMALPAMQAELTRARSAGDSVGGVAECAIARLKPGLGGPLFDSVEGELARLLFAIPGVKAVEFGAGARFAGMCGSAANDPFILAQGVRTLTNNSGGINGGITNGMPLILRVTFRPVPTIAMAQRTVDMQRGVEVTHAFGGRNDVCILPRGAVAVEALACFTLMGLMLINDAEVEAEHGR